MEDDDFDMDTMLAEEEAMAQEQAAMASVRFLGLFPPPPFPLFLPWAFIHALLLR